MRKGFTLIELLAVIVILAIIAIIAVPIVLNIINDAKESSLLRSAEFYLDAVEYTIADAFLYHGGLTDDDYSITKNGDVCKVNETTCSESNILKVEVTGDKPTGGFIKIKNGKVNKFQFIYKDKRVIKENNELVLRNMPKISPSGNMYGDANGDGTITKEDAELILEFNANQDGEIDIIASDVDNSGVVDGYDATLVLQFVAGWNINLGP